MPSANKNNVPGSGTRVKPMSSIRTSSVFPSTQTINAKPWTPGKTPNKSSLSLLPISTKISVVLITPGEINSTSERLISSSEPRSDAKKP